MGKVVWESVWYLWFGQISKILIWSLKQRDYVAFPSFCLVIAKWALFRSETLCVCMATAVRHLNAVCHSFCLDSPGNSGASAGTAWNSQENVPFQGGAPNDLDVWTTHSHLSLTAFCRRNGKMVLMRNAQGLKCKNENVLLKSKIK